MAFQRGLSEEHEQKSTQLLRDTRSMGERISDFFKVPAAVATLMLVFAGLIEFLPELFDLFFLLALGCFLFSITRKHTLPFRMPMRSKMLDYNDPKPGTVNEPQKARGIYFFGNEKSKSPSGSSGVRYRIWPERFKGQFLFVGIHQH